MSNAVAVIYFSGTGNTEGVAGFIAHEMEKHDNVEVLMLKNKEYAKGQKTY